MCLKSEIAFEIYQQKISTEMLGLSKAGDYKPSGARNVNQDGYTRFL